MKKQFSLSLFVLLLITLLHVCSCTILPKSNFPKKEKTERMKNITFIPKEFHDIELGYYKTTKNFCSPIFRDEMRTVNSITINTPQKIICECDTNVDNSIFIIPVSAIYSVSQRRGLKYDSLSAKMLHIKKVGEETVYSGEIVDKDESLIILPPNYSEQERKRQERIKNAQKYRDNELEQQGLASVNYLNVNLMEYICFPVTPGKYEIYLSFLGLESNHLIVEINIE